MKSLFSKILLMGLVILSMTACEEKPQPQPQQETKRASLESYADFTYNNYNVNKSAYFLRETGNLDEYYVTLSSIYYTALDGISDKKMTESGFICINMIKEYADNVAVLLVGFYDSDDAKELSWKFGIETTLSGCIKNAIPPFNLEPDEIFLENEVGQWMVLKKGVGIKTMSDNKGHTWTAYNRGVK